MASRLGYVFHQLKLNSSTLSAQLDISIFAKPTEQHFDPETVGFCIADPRGGIEHLTITHPWRLQKQLQVCAGRIIMRDRKDKVVQAFSFGGKLEISNFETFTFCQITSTAPIIELIDTQDTETIVVTEFEAWLAKHRARWAGNDLGFGSQLASIEPFTLFVAGVAKIDDRLSRSRFSMRYDQYRRVGQETRRIIRLLQENGVWPPAPPVLTDLL